MQRMRIADEWLLLTAEVKGDSALQRRLWRRRRARGTTLAVITELQQAGKLEFFYPENSTERMVRILSAEQIHDPASDFVLRTLAPLTRRPLRKIIRQRSTCPESLLAERLISIGWLGPASNVIGSRFAGNYPMYAAHEVQKIRERILMAAKAGPEADEHDLMLLTLLYCLGVARRAPGSPWPRGTARSLPRVGHCLQE